MTDNDITKTTTTKTTITKLTTMQQATSTTLKTAPPLLAQRNKRILPSAWGFVLFRRVHQYGTGKIGCFGGRGVMCVTWVDDDQRWSSCYHRCLRVICFKRMSQPRDCGRLPSSHTPIGENWMTMVWGTACWRQLLILVDSEWILEIVRCACAITALGLSSVNSSSKWGLWLEASEMCNGGEACGLAQSQAQ